MYFGFKKFENIIHTTKNSVKTMRVTSVCSEAFGLASKLDKLSKYYFYVGDR